MDDDLGNLDDLHYDGSRIFSWVAEIFGISVDLVNFLIVQILSLILASIFRTYFHPNKTSTTVRHVFCITFGLLFGYFCFGQQVIHIALLPAICYIVIHIVEPKIVQRTVAVVALLYLSCIHFHRQYYDYGSYSLDITGPLMIITQKVTSIAFSIHDGLACEFEELSKDRQYHSQKLRKLPSALEFFSYVLHFQGIMTGPLVFYQDYIEFIEGTHILKYSTMQKQNKKIDLVVEPSPFKAITNKIVASIICAYIFMTFRKVFPIKTLKDEDFIYNTNFAFKFWYIMMATTVVRFKYYFAWLTADAICNCSGLGFNGFDESGTPKWNLISNINVIQFEFALSFRDSINNWNMGTNKWLRMVVYDRVPNMRSKDTVRTILTFALSALWHGFYPGYYVTFATGALVVMSARMARKILRHHFQMSPVSRTIYDILTFVTTRIFMAYTTFPFVLLEFQASLKVYLKLYMCLHILAAVIVFLLPSINTRLKSGKKGEKSKNGSLSTNGDKYESVCFTNGKDISKKLTNRIKDKIGKEAHNIEEFFDKTVTGITELTDDFKKINDRLIPNENLMRKRNTSNEPNDCDLFIKKEANAFNCLAQNTNVLPSKW
ncbi:lysophospholipid acyltransferase 6 [Culicoides brevitarsis]|uniref:lysophospholipid acyltransferase 6 n=1 Tax=Culicoides brevitarsis TaxID=469753 RepID=UPI00307C259E